MLWRHELRTVVIKLQQPLLVGREPEIVTLFLDPFDGSPGWCEAAAIRPLGQLGFIKKSLITDGIPARIFGKINVACRSYPFPKLACCSVVTGLRGAHHIIGACEKSSPHCVDLRCRAVCELLRRQAFLGCGSLHFLAMLVHPRPSSAVLL